MLLGLLRRWRAIGLCQIPANKPLADGGISIAATHGTAAVRRPPMRKLGSAAVLTTTR